MLCMTFCAEAVMEFCESSKEGTPMSHEASGTQHGGPKAHLARFCSSRTSLKWVLAMSLQEGCCAAKWRSAAHSRPTPSAHSVPFPNSSMMHNDLHAHAPQLLGLHHDDWSPLTVCELQIFEQMPGH